MDAPLNGVCTDLLSLTNPQPWTDLDPPPLWGDQLLLRVGSLETYIHDLEAAVSVFSSRFWLPESSAALTHSPGPQTLTQLPGAPRRC